jgi:site-specific DNA-methyltransferase (adenine-specific)
MATWQLEHADCRDLLAALPDGCVEATCQDPPYEINFAGAKWDRSGIAFSPDVWQQALRVCKPGAHLLAFGAARTYHRLACAVEDSGWEIRDGLSWVFASGMVKSVDASKAIDEKLGRTADRPIVGWQTLTGTAATSFGKEGRLTGVEQAVGQKKVIPLTTGASEEARLWEGWGTGIAPAHEPLVLARKPLDGTLAHNALKHGTGFLNLDGCALQGDRVFKNLMLDEAASESFLPHDKRPMFFCAKVTNEEREFGCDGLPKMDSEQITGRGKASIGAANARAGAGRTSEARANYHKTVKPVRLLRYLLRLITPPGGVVLDLFAGSGSLGIAAALEGLDYIGVELDEGHCRIARARIKATHELVRSGRPLPKWAT